MARIIIDMDEVMADIIPHLVDNYYQATGETITAEAMHGKHLEECCSQPQLIRQLLYTPGFFRTAPLIADTQVVVKALNEHHEVFIVSAAMEFPQSLIEKYEWLEEHFPFLTWRQIAFTGSKALVSGDYMIDDHLKNLDYFDGEKLMFTSPHNALIEKYTRVNNWKEVADILLPGATNPLNAKIASGTAL
ncbi:5'(3')-deoxyribonucleotidase [Filimonas zeae]|uniref:5'(3')-deoxyribonucleotidase n=1 Tax=Filimonas zeae TaxID=1737353 RepID=A0A917J119_9BACT|nr:5'(3')-deoxyribonucleotidase [Filimonas zeae]MDR6341541.1 5'(3')-deoxyribonucleotidase [Filimonas zeae]GGH75362.1 putative 5'(3')-deoxyribonucleotidase [Filimonas zeae]